MPYTYRKSERLRKNREFVSTLKGKRLSVDGLSLFYAPNTTGHFRVGISVGKKLGNAVTRNRLKRRVRDCIRKVLSDTSLAIDLVFVARRELSTLDYGQIHGVVERVLRKTVLRSKKAESAER